MVSNGKLEVAPRDLLSAPLRPANAHRPRKVGVWKGAALSRFVHPATVRVTRTPWLCAAAGFVLSCCSFWWCFFTDCRTKIHVAAWQAGLL